MPKIEFISDIADLIEQPKPSLNFIPDDYKKLSKRIDQFKVNNQTLKGCIPFLDSLTSGYIIPLPIEVCFETEIIENTSVKKIKIEMHTADIVPQELKNNFYLASHDDLQVPNSLRSNYRSINVVLKMVMPWIIKTPPGYSCLITNPLNRNSPFKIIDAIVDTDSYKRNLNYPFYWTGNSEQKETWIPKGSPFVLVIPFKRENWKLSIKKEPFDIKESFKLASYVNDKYKRLFWKKKSYR